MAMSSPRPASARELTDRHDLCKHVWAVVLAADAEGYLIGDAPITEDAFLSPIIWRARRPSRPARVASPRRSKLGDVFSRTCRRAPPAMRPARHRGTHRERFSTSSMPRRSPAIRCQSSRSNGAPVRKTASGESRNPLRWRSPTFPACPTNTIARCWRNSSAHRTAIFSARRATNTSRASFRLAGPLIGRVLPLIARSGRLYPPRWQRASGRSVAARLGSGETWTFQLDVELVPDGRIRVDGAFVRGDVRMPVTGPALLLSREFLIADDGVSRVDHRGAFAWVIELRKSGPAMIPAEAAPKLIEALAQSNVDPSQLPELLRYEVVEAMPKPRIRMARSSRPQGRGTREELDAAVEFDYAGATLPARPETAAYDPERRRMIRATMPSNARRCTVFTARLPSAVVFRRERGHAGDRGGALSSGRPQSR